MLKSILKKIEGVIVVFDDLLNCNKIAIDLFFKRGCHKVLEA